MKKIIIEFITIFIIILMLFKYNIEIKNNLEFILILFFKNVIFSLFPIIFITNYIKYNILSKTNNRFIKFISLILSYAPSNAVIANSQNELLYSSVINPLFSYVVLIKYFSLNKVLIIIFTNMVLNYFLLYKNLQNNISKSNIESLTFIIKETTQCIINILGIIIFFNILISLCGVLIDKKFLFFLEITNGFNAIYLFNNIFIKSVLLIFLNSFGGAAIFFQIKSINKDANYQLIIKKIYISFMVTIVTLLLLLIS